MLNPFQRNQLIGYVHSHIDTRINPASLARSLGLSPDYFSRLFRNAFGLPPRSWLMRERIRLASMKMMFPSQA
jgi:AraC-like DNA-binding protein